MGRKILIVGGVAGGATTAARLRRCNEEDTIIVFERGPHASFSNCSLPYHLSGMIKEAGHLVLFSPELFKVQFNIDTRVNQEVMTIDREKKEVLVKNTLTGETYTETYDKLVLSPGAAPIVPKIPGIDHVTVHTVRNVVDIDRLNKEALAGGKKKITVIGGGFIGIEVAENFCKAGHEVTIIEGTNQILRPYDYDMVQIFHKELLDHKINLIVEDTVTRFEKNQVILSSGHTVKTDLVVMAVGIAPETKLAKEAGLEIGETGAIHTDSYQRTSDPDIYAVGDAVEVFNELTHTMTKLSLAGPALKQARIAADHMSGRAANAKGVIGSSAIKVFDYNGAATGLTESQIKALGMNIKYNIVRVILSDKVGLMPDAAPMHFKLIFEVPTGRILGAQAIGKGDVSKRVDVIATAIKFNGTVQSLKELELCYAPPFSTAKDIVNYAGYVGSNLLNGEFKQVNVDKVRELVEKKAVIVDVREVYEFDRGHIKGAINLPLSQLRERYQELPKDKPLYIHCRSGQRSYNAVMALQNLGYTDVYNITGSFLGISLYEYFNDVRLNRESIVTEYNFR